MNSPPPVTTSPLLSWDHKNLVQGLQTSAGEYQYFFLSDILYHCVSLLLNLFTSILLWPFSSLLIFNPHQHSCPHSIPEHTPHPGAVSQTSPTPSSSASSYWLLHVLGQLSSASGMSSLSLLFTGESTI